MHIQEGGRCEEERGCGCRDDTRNREGTCILKWCARGRLGEVGVGARREVGEAGEGVRRERGCGVAGDGTWTLSPRRLSEYVNTSFSNDLNMHIEI